MRFEVPRVSSMCCPAMESVIVDVHILVPSHFLLVLDSIVVSHRGSRVIFFLSMFLECCWLLAQERRLL